MYSEALRVLNFRSICLEANQVVEDGLLLESIGREMNSSQGSCASDFECSCPELDELVTLARVAGAFGSRLTGKFINVYALSNTEKIIVESAIGAGWGGCTISVVAESHVHSFINQVCKTYKPYKGLSDGGVA